MDAPKRYIFMHQAGAIEREDGRFTLASEHARIVAEKDARIAELEDKAKSETDARRDAFEEAAKVADQWATDQQRQFGNGGPAAAIRALAEKG